MTKLSQIVAIEKGVKQRATRDFTNAHRAASIPAPLSGITRTYQPRDAEGETLPGESTHVQYTVEELNEKVRTTLTRLFDVTATKDWANTTARADVVVDGTVVVKNVPVPYLLFLEKQLTDLRTYVEGLPTLDPAEVWVEHAENLHRTEPTRTTRTKKVPKSFVAYEATKEHPAQVTVFNEDVIVGDWTTTKFSGALTEDRRAYLVDRVDRLQAAVKYAREQANGTEIDDVHVADSLLGFVFD